MKLSVLGTLVVAISVIVDGKAVACKDVEVSDLSTGDMFAARSKAKADEFWGIHELAAKTKLVDADGNKHQLSYEALRDTSSANFKKLEELDFELQLKLTAESLESQSS